MNRPTGKIEAKKKAKTELIIYFSNRPTGLHVRRGSRRPIGRRFTIGRIGNLLRRHAQSQQRHQEVGLTSRSLMAPVPSGDRIDLVHSILGISSPTAPSVIPYRNF